VTVQRWPGWRNVNWRDGAALIGILMLGVVLPTVVGAVSGSLDIPRHDDWSYRRLAVHLFDSGGIELDGSVSTALIGQLVAAQPFLWLSGGQTWGLSLTGILFDSVAMVAGFLMLRRLLPTGRAAFAILLLPLFPGFLPYAPSFMTDVPALAAEFTCLALGMVALARQPIRLPWLIASLTVGFFGFTIREFALAAPASVLILAVVVEPRRIGSWLSAAAFVAACVGFSTWRGSLPGQIVRPPAAAFPALEANVVHAASSVALLLLPAAAVGWARCWRQVRLLDLAIGAVAGLLLVGGMIGGLVTTGVMPPVLLEDVMSPWGTPGPLMLIGGRPLLIPDQIWAALNGLGLLATIIVPATFTGMIGAVLRNRRAKSTWAAARRGSPIWLLVIFAGGMGLGLTAYGLTGWLFDRYYWSLIPPLAALLLVFPPAMGEPVHAGGAALVRAATAASWLAAGVLGATSLALLLNSAAYDAAKWRAGEALVAAGIPAESIDAGFEWVGYHIRGPADLANAGPGLIWYERWWPSFRLCGVVASGPQGLEGGELVSIDTEAYRLLLFGGDEEPLYLYRIHGPGCP
jgi:hypothetical protein